MIVNLLLLVASKILVIKLLKFLYPYEIRFNTFTLFIFPSIGPLLIPITKLERISLSVLKSVDPLKSFTANRNPNIDYYYRNI